MLGTGAVRRKVTEPAGSGVAVTKTEGRPSSRRHRALLPVFSSFGGRRTAKAVAARFSIVIDLVAAGNMTQEVASPTRKE